jgi:hypothetical protein
MTHDVSYGSPTAVEQAIKAAANQAFRENPSTSVDERIRLEYFRRFLSRVFPKPETRNGYSREAQACWHESLQHGPPWTSTFSMQNSRLTTL